MARVLLQAEGECQKLGGIPVGGWIVLSVLAGFLCGIAATLLLQWHRRRKQLRYLEKAPLGLQHQPSAIAMPHNPAATTAVPAARCLPPAPCSSTGVQPKYYSPLTKSLSVGPGMLYSQLSQGDIRRNSRVTDGGDINAKGLQDQRSVPSAGHAPLQAPTANINNPFVVHGQQQHGAATAAAAAAAAGSAATGHLHQGLRASLHFDQRQVHVGGASWMQLPQQPSSADLNTQHPLPTSTVPQADSSLASPAASSPSTIHQVPGTQMQQQQQSEWQPADQPWCSTPAGSTPHSSAIQAEHSAGGGSSGIKAEASATESEIADSYELDELDEDWARLLLDVDARLIAQGARVMNARERSVAIKKMLVATGTRGVDFAMHATLREVLAFRSIHGS